MQKFHCINIKCHDIKAIESCLNTIQPPNITDISGLPSIIMQMLNKVTAYIVEYKNCDHSLLLLTDTYMSAELSQKLSANTQSTAIYTLFTEYDNAVYIFDNGKRVFEFEQHGFEPPIFYCDDTYKQSETQKSFLEKLTHADIDTDLIIELEAAFDCTFTTNYDQINDTQIRCDIINPSDSVYFYEKGKGTVKITPPY